MAKICAIVPMYNEKKCAYETINAIKRIKTVDEIIAVDDGSSESTWDILRSIDGIKRLRHFQNAGKAESIRDGTAKLA
jgi:glycosyltransferase involved in cell wall biosynthesis